MNIFILLEKSHSVIRLELKGGDNSMRIRQVRVLGRMEGESLKVGRQHAAAVIQQKNTEAETLRVFRLITSQVSCPRWKCLYSFLFSSLPKLNFVHFCF